MPGMIIFPPEYPIIYGPLIFLAGPIQGSPNWQDNAIAWFHHQTPSVHIACPRKEYLNDSFVYEAQVDWETYYLRYESRNGVLLFWLACEVEHNCARAYAQTSRFELGEWKARHEYEGTKIVVGIEEGFSNARYIRRRITQDCPSIPLFDTLETTCYAAKDAVAKSIP
jgi:hypothetical protein